MAFQLSSLTILVLFSLFTLVISQKKPTDLQTYIIQLNPQSQSRSDYSSTHKWHLSFLERSIITTIDLSETPTPSSRLLYSYHSAMEGFSALLTTQELQTLKTHPDVIAVRPDTLLHLHTTYSYKFLGLTSPIPNNPGSTPWLQSNYGRGTIIGLLDTGIWPESPSFNDNGIPPPPKTWRGICQEGREFNSSNCNNKLIGARFFDTGHRAATSSSRYVTKTPPPSDYSSPRDGAGHGTHTSSTAAGSPVRAASVLGYGEGEAKGMAPAAHIAVYKVCWLTGCYTSDVLAGMDAAISDRVNVLSLSLGGFPVPLYDDSIAIGSFRAVESGIIVVCAAGNNGPIANSVANEAPWIATVGASTLDRRFPAYVKMGNGKYLYGESIYPHGNHRDQLSETGVVYVTGGGELCIAGTLPRSIVHGKIVVCDRGINGRAEKGEVVKNSGGIGMILANTKFNLEEDSVDVHLIPATLIGYKESLQLKHYINTTHSRDSPKAKIIFSGTVIGRGTRAPSVAQFSSRGPSLNNPSILKPDIIAPGVNIIAAWPENLGPSGVADDPRRVNFTVLSGTSMSCPHVSGISALIRSAHPEWSPAAVKSALMTTADVTDHDGKPILDGDTKASLFAMGAGQVSPGKALNPGLVYDVKPKEYLTHLCSLGYTGNEIFTITHKNISCQAILKRNRGFSLNYPSISVGFKRTKTRTVAVRRVTNVGEGKSSYSLEVEEPEGVKIIVRPKQLVFEKRYETLSYKMYFSSKRKDVGAGFGQGYLTWVNCNERLGRVRSPISVTWKK